MRSADPISLAKVMLWEEAKGKMRALVALEGYDNSGESERGKVQLGRFKSEIISENVEKFIEDFESNGYHE